MNGCSFDLYYHENNFWSFGSSFPKSLKTQKMSFERYFPSDLRIYFLGLFQDSPSYIPGG